MQGNEGNPRPDADFTMNGVTRESTGFGLSLDTSVYSMEAIKKTAYKFADRTSLIITPNPPNISLIFNFIGKHAEADPEQVIADFCNELLDQDLREIVTRETGPLRDLILAHAFSRSSLTQGD